MSEAGQDHDHDRVPGTRAIGLAIVLNLAITAAEAGVGAKVGSLALIADALHNLSDVGSLVLAWLGARLAQRQATSRHTFGFLRAEPMVAFVNGLVLLPLAGSLIWAGLQRFGTSSTPAGPVVMFLGAVALAANAGSVLLLKPHAGDDLGARSAVLHLLADAAASGAVILGGALMWLGVPWVDPVLSIVIGLFTIKAAFGVTREAAHLLAEGAPEGAGAEAVAATLREVEGVQGVHHVHVWSLSSRLRAVSAHLVVADRLLSDMPPLLRRAEERLQAAHRIGHPTLQLEAVACGPADVLADPRPTPDPA